MREKLLQELEEVEHKAWESLARYKFQMFGYWAAIWVHLNRLSGEKRENPWRSLVNMAKRRNQMFNAKGELLKINTQKMRARIEELFRKVEPFNRSYVRSILVYFMAALDELDELRGNVVGVSERTQQIINCRNNKPTPEQCLSCLDCIGEFDDLEVSEVKKDG